MFLSVQSTVCVPIWKMCWYWARVQPSSAHRYSRKQCLTCVRLSSWSSLVWMLWIVSLISGWAASAGFLPPEEVPPPLKPGLLTSCWKRSFMVFMVDWRSWRFLVKLWTFSSSCLNLSFSARSGRKGKSYFRAPITEAFTVTWRQRHTWHTSTITSSPCWSPAEVSTAHRLLPVSFIQIEKVLLFTACLILKFDHWDNKDQLQDVSVISVIQIYLLSWQFSSEFNPHTWFCTITEEIHSVSPFRLSHSKSGQIWIFLRIKVSNK